MSKLPCTSRAACAEYFYDANSSAYEAFDSFRPKKPAAIGRVQSAIRKSASEIIDELLRELDTVTDDDIQYGRIVGLLNEYTPIALANRSNPSLTLLASRDDDNKRRVDLKYRPTLAKKSTPLNIQVKTRSDNVSPRDLPAGGGIVMFAEDFLNQDLVTSQIIADLHVKAGQPGGHQRLREARTQYLTLLDNRMKRPRAHFELLQAKAEAARRRPLSRSIGQAVPELKAIRDKL